MVFHDETLDRLTLATGPVAAKTPAELKAVAFRQGSDRIQTLGELLEQVCGRVPLVIELKSGWKEHGPLEARTAQLLKGYNGKAAVMSFDPFCIERFRGAAPELPRGLVACRFRDRQDWPMLNRWERFMMRHLLSAAVARPQFIAYDIEGLPSLAPWAARRIFRLPLLTWTVRTPEQRRRAQRHADAMIFEGFRP
ncbi:MAG: glycerophosphodiester phosphodiesterase [Methyloligellaceae bacterium]